MSSKTMLPAIAILISLASLSAGFAQDAPVEHPARQGQSMMGGTSSTPQGPSMTDGTNPAVQGPGMTGGTGNTAEMTNMIRQMTRMMENCNRMMESAGQNPPASEKPPAAQNPPG